MADTNLLILAREYKKLREEVKKVLQMPKGDKGDQGEKGDTGATGPQGFPGRDGKDGINGLNGADGRDGKDGQDGKDGLDGVGVQNAYIDFDNSLVIVLSDGREVNAGYLNQETKDAVMATFKQGASTINELLPDQDGNTGKVLKTDGENVYWAADGAGAGTVTSVALSAPTGLSVSGSPITSSGTLTLSYSAGYSLPLTASQTNWDTAYGWGNHATAGYALSSSLATVATSGSYNDLSDKPTIPAAYTDASVDTHLNTSTATTGQVLGWSGTDYDWINQLASSGGITTVAIVSSLPGSPNATTLYIVV